MMKIKAWWSHFTSLLWHMPGRTASAALKAASAASWAQIGAGISATFVLLAYGHAIWRGGWPKEAWSKQLDLLGQGQIIAGIIIIIALVAIAGLRLGVSANKDGLKLNAERDDADDNNRDHVTRITTDVHTPPTPPAPPPTVSVKVENPVADTPPKQE